MEAVWCACGGRFSDLARIDSLPARVSDSLPLAATERVARFIAKTTKGLALAAREPALTLDSERRGPYTDLIYGSANEIAPAAVEGIMRDRGYEPLTQIGREMLAKGRAEGTAEGELRGLRVAVATVCRAAGISWTDARAATVEKMNAVELEALLAALVRDRAWPTH